MRILGILLAMTVAGCGQGDRFAAGTWQVDGWMESELGSTRGHPGANISDTVKLTERDAASPAGEVFFRRFYHGVRNGDVRFENGRVEGSYEQAGVDDIAGHTVPVSGTYGRDRFTVTFEFTVFGMKARQIVEGKLVTPA